MEGQVNFTLYMAVVLAASGLAATFVGSTLVSAAIIEWWRKREGDRPNGSAITSIAVVIAVGFAVGFLAVVIPFGLVIFIERQG